MSASDVADTLVYLLDGRRPATPPVSVCLWAESDMGDAVVKRACEFLGLNRVHVELADVGVPGTGPSSIDMDRDASAVVVISGIHRATVPQIRVGFEMLEQRTYQGKQLSGHWTMVLIYHPRTWASAGLRLPSHLSDRMVHLHAHGLVDEAVRGAQPERQAGRDVELEG